MKLYSYWRSTTSVRVRAALNLKGVAYDLDFVDLTKGEQSADDYRSLNPVKGVPTLVTDDGTVLTQSFAIIDWLDAVYPEPRMLPADPAARAQVQAAALVIGTEIHPINNLKVLNYVRSLGHDADEVKAWNNHWMHEGFTAFQALIRDDTPFCFGDRPDLADLCLVGQMVNARRWGLDMGPFARLVEIDDRARAVDAIAQALPEAQPDAKPA